VVRVTQSLFDVHVLLMFVCPFVLFLLAIAMSVLRRYTDYDYPVGIVQLFLPIISVQFQYIFENSKQEKLCQASIQLLLLEQWKHDHIRQVIACSAQQFRIVSSVNILLYCYSINKCKTSESNGPC
jgi:hypothetical protein